MKEVEAGRGGDRWGVCGGDLISTFLAAWQNLHLFLSLSPQSGDCCEALKGSLWIWFQQLAEHQKPFIISRWHGGGQEQLRWGEGAEENQTNSISLGHLCCCHPPPQRSLYTGLPHLCDSFTVISLLGKWCTISFGVMSSPWPRWHRIKLDFFFFN